MRKNYFIKLVRYMKNVYHIENCLNKLSDDRWVTSEGWVNTDENNYGTWYYVGSDKKVVKGWNKIGGNFYYFNYPDGSMTYNNTINGFYLEDSGKMVNGTG